MSTARLVVQLVVSLAAVLALMWLVSKVLRNAGGGRGVGTLDVVARRQLSRGASVSVVRVGDRAIVLGVTEQAVNLLAEVPVSELEVEPVAPAPQQVRVPVAVSAAPAGKLAGSILSPGTWRQALDVLRERTARRG